MPLNIPLPPNSGTTYGDVQFDASAETTDFSFKQVYSEDQRYIVHSELAITIRSYVTLGMDDPQLTVDSQMTHLRETLETSGLPFTYKNGAGTISVNTGAPGGQQDIDFGPKPTLLRFKPTGSGTSAKIFWSVVIRIPECPVNTVYSGIKEFNYKVSWNINKGLTRRTINGFFVIANNFNPGTRVTRDSADKYRETLTAAFAVPVNFHRMAPQNYTLSGNRSREEFTIVDEQLPNQNTPPPGTLLPQFTHRVTIDKLYSVLWNGTFNATYPVPLGAPAGTKTFYYFWRAVLAAPACDLCEPGQSGFRQQPRHRQDAEATGDSAWLLDGRVGRLRPDGRPLHVELFVPRHLEIHRRRRAVVDPIAGFRLDDVESLPQQRLGGAWSEWSGLQQRGGQFGGRH